MTWRVMLMLMLLGSAAPAAVADEAQGGTSARYRIYMALYRGETNAERGFMDYLRDRSLPVDFIVRDADKDPAKVEAMREEIRRLRPDLVYSFGTTLTRAIAGAVDAVDPATNVTDIPVLFNVVADPLGAKLVTDLDHPGRNVTGTTHAVPVTAQYRTMREALQPKRLGVIYNPKEANSVLSVDELIRVAQRDGLSVAQASVSPDPSPQLADAAVRRAVESLVDQKVDVIYLPSDSFVIEHAGIISELATSAGVATFAATEDPIRASGATMGLASAYYNVGQFAAFKAMQILRDRKSPAEIPVESIDRFEFVVNVEAARRIHRFPPVSLLRVAELVCYVPGACPRPLPRAVAVAAVSKPVEAVRAVAATPEPSSRAPSRRGEVCDPDAPYVLAYAGTGGKLALTRCVGSAGARRLLEAPTPSRSLVRAVQAELERRGLAVGKIDGLLGPLTRGAIQRFQRSEGLSATGEIDFAFLDRLQDRTIAKAP